jgi:hypothetical protein
MMGAMAGPAGRLSWRRAKDVSSEPEKPERVREREVGMVSDLLGDDQQAHECRPARVQKSFREGGAVASRAVKRRSTICHPFDCRPSEKRGARRVTSSALSAGVQRLSKATWQPIDRRGQRRGGSRGGRAGRGQG